MKTETVDYIWKYAIVAEAKKVLGEYLHEGGLSGEEIDGALKKLGESLEDPNSILKNDFKNRYDNLRGFSKYAYLKNPDGLSNRYLVSTYIILSLAKIKPFNAGENEGTLMNEILAIRIGLWVLCLFKKYQEQKKDPGLWDTNNLKAILDHLGNLEKQLYYHLYYDINDNNEKKSSILEMSNIIWMIESFIDLINNINDNEKQSSVGGERDQAYIKGNNKDQSVDGDNEQYAANKYIEGKGKLSEDNDHNLLKPSIEKRIKDEWRRSLDKRWDSIWNNYISKVAVEIVDRNKGRTEFDRTSKYTILNEYLSLLNEAKSKYVKLSGVSSDRYMITACFILAIAKSQPLRYRYDIHAKKGIYNENLAIEAGLRLLNEFKLSDSKEDEIPGIERYIFPKPFHNKTYKELLCLMLHYDIRENIYSILAIANILLMIEQYTYVYGYHYSDIKRNN